MLDKKEVVAIRTKILPNETKTITERIKADGTVENINVRFYYGQQLALKVYPYVRHMGNKLEGLLTYPEGAENSISGDDDIFKFDIVCPVKNDDELYIIIENTSSEFEYNVAIDIVVDYYAGQSRIVGGVI